MNRQLLFVSAFIIVTAALRGVRGRDCASFNSFLNCTQLRAISPADWLEGSNDMFGTETVCGESNIKSPLQSSGCHNAIGFQSALAVCTSAGARLCTSEEMANDETRGTGCGYDGKAIWTGTRGTCGAGNFITRARLSVSCRSPRPRYTPCLRHARASSRGFVISFAAWEHVY